MLRDNIEAARSTDFKVEVHRFFEYDINATNQDDSLYAALACCLCELFKLNND